MKFKRIQKRKNYPTWVSVNKLRECKIYILYVPSEKYYHFQIICDIDLEYCSLNNGNTFNDFKECCRSAELWVRSHIKI